MFRRFLQELGRHRITYRKRNMAQQVMPFADELLLRMRALIESIATN